MADVTTVGTLLVNDALPKDLRRPSWSMTKDEVHKLFVQLAEKHPDQYKDVLKGLSDVGRTAAWTEGLSVSLASLRKSKVKEQMLAPVREQIRAIVDDDTLTDTQRKEAITGALLDIAPAFQKAILEESRTEDSPFSMQVESGARGKKSDLVSLRGGDLLATDTADRHIPIPLLHSYAEGFTPAEYFAASYGQRKGAVDVKLSTADAGYLAKQLVNAAHRQMVTRDRPMQTRLPVGLPVDTADKDNVGAVLAMDAGPYKAGTILTDDMLEDLKDQDQDEIVIHSPLTELSEDGGVSQWAAGKRTRAGLSQVGDNIGIPAAQAIAERISQGMLSSKHSSGVGSRVGRSGFEYLNRLLQAPENFPGAGPLAETAGQVQSVKDAPQGGKYVVVGDKDYYIQPDLEVLVKQGDTIEVGDDLSDGTPHPEQLVRLRGMGEARRLYTGLLRDALKDSGVQANRRNVESVVAGLLNWGKVTNPDGLDENVYDDVVPWNRAMAKYVPRPTSKEQDLDKAYGQYLDEPALHYTPGTRVTKKVADRLKRWGIGRASVHADPPDIEPHMVRAVLGSYHDPDWRTRLSGFYTSSAFEKALHRGLTSDTKSTSYVPALTENPSEFGRDLSVTGKYGRAQ